MSDLESVDEFKLYSLNAHLLYNIVQYNISQQTLYPGMMDGSILTSLHRFGT